MPRGIVTRLARAARRRSDLLTRLLRGKVAIHSHGDHSPTRGFVGGVFAPIGSARIARALDVGRGPWGVGAHLVGTRGGARSTRPAAAHIRGDIDNPPVIVDYHTGSAPARGGGRDRRESGDHDDGDEGGQGTDREHESSASLALWVGTSHPIGATLAIPIQTSLKQRDLYRYSQGRRLKKCGHGCTHLHNLYHNTVLLSSRS